MGVDLGCNGAASNGTVRAYAVVEDRPLRVAPFPIMIVSPSAPHLAAAAAAHYCPVCLRRVSPTQVDRRAHRESCHSGDFDVALLHCPTCHLVLAAEVDVQAQVGTVSTT